MKVLNIGKAQAANTNINATSHDISIKTDGSFGIVSSGGGKSKIGVFDVAQMFKMTNCLACRYPKNDPSSHHLDNCTVLKDFGFIITCNPAKDK